MHRLVKFNPDYEVLFRLQDGLRRDAGQRYSIREPGIEEKIVHTGEEIEQKATEVKISIPMSHNVLTIVEEYGQ